MFIAYRLVVWSRDLNTKFKLGICLFEGMKITKNVDPDKYGYGNRFDASKESKDESKDTLKQYKELWKRIKDLIRSIKNNLDDYSEKYIKINFNSDDHLPLKKTLKLHNIIIVVRSVFDDTILNTIHNFFR